MNHEPEEDTVDFTFDFTEQRDEPIELPLADGPTHPPTILLRGQVMASRWHTLTD
ncbi:MULTISPECIES: hypothetical protein [Streptomyces]|jgi:hypothetical protein|uniref:hypothetical protein n=1 Tax=Streptomyces TaxID=1883 RepID=UPI00131C8987|nr:MULTISPECIES: hypothetical protein [Streptomyces]